MEARGEAANGVGAPARGPAPLTRSERIVVLFFALVPFTRAIALWGDGWVAVGDNANIAIRSQDVGTRATPLVGMPSGLVGLVPDSHAAHPGPLVFWAIGPWVRAFGAGPLPVLLAVAAVGALATVALLWCAHRLAGRRGTAAGALVLTMVVVVTPFDLVQPLNPAVALVPALAALVAAAAAAAGDRRSAPVLIGAASFAAQAEIAYAPMLFAVVLAVGLRRARRCPDLPKAFRARRWVGTAMVALACWAGPLLDVAVHGGGNLTETIDGTSRAKAALLGPPAAIDAVRQALNPLGWVLWAQSAPPPGGVAGVLLFVVGIALLAWAVRRNRLGRGAASAVVLVGTVAVAVAALTQALTPAASGREATYLFPVLVAGGFTWFGAAAAGAPTVGGRPLPRARAAAAVLVVLLLVGLRAHLEGPHDPGGAAVDPLARQVEDGLRPDRLLLVTGGGPTSQSVLRGVGLRLEQAGFDARYPDDQQGYVGPERTVPEGAVGIDRLLVSRPLVGPSPPGWRRAGFTHQAASFQIGQVLAATSGTDVGVLVDGPGLRDLGQQLIDHPERLRRLPDLVLATLVEEGIVDDAGVDDGLRAQFLAATDEDALEVWLVPASR